MRDRYRKLTIRRQGNNHIVIQSKFRPTNTVPNFAYKNDFSCVEPR